MFKELFKKFIKSRFIVGLLVKFAQFYILLVYKTARWQISWKDQDLQNNFDILNGAIIVFWHNQILFSLEIFKNYKKIHALVSPHRDGRIINDVILAMRDRLGSIKDTDKATIINGSTNRSPLQAVKAIMKSLQQGNKVIITPDGPRGPVYQINSSLIRIAKKCQKPIIPVACQADRFWQLRSWDKMIIPKPFAKISVIFDKKFDLSQDDEQDKVNLAARLVELSKESKLILEK